MGKAMGGDPSHCGAEQFCLMNNPMAVLDVHHYFAWAGDGSGIPAANCSTDAALAEYVKHGMDSFTAKLHAVAGANNLTGGVACSEWSLSVHHKDYVSPCTAPNALDVMYDQQVAAFKRAAVSQFMWGWRMPQGGIHEAKWSLKLHLTGKH
jgi:hypothetical protein